jgi:hypothetical protein
MATRHNLSGAAIREKTSHSQIDMNVNLRVEGFAAQPESDYRVIDVVLRRLPSPCSA